MRQFFLPAFSTCFFLYVAIQCTVVWRISCPSQAEPCFCGFLTFPSPCLYSPHSLIPLSLVVMSTVRLSHVWGSHQGLDEAMINEREGKSRNDQRKGHGSACTLSHQPCQTLIPRYTGSIVHTTHWHLSLPPSLPLLYAFSLFLFYHDTQTSSATPRNQVSFNLKDAFSSFHLEKDISHVIYSQGHCNHSRRL